MATNKTAVGVLQRQGDQMLTLDAGPTARLSMRFTRPGSGRAQGGDQPPGLVLCHCGRPHTYLGMQ